MSILFSPNDPDVRINEEPAPRLKLESGQAVLVDRQKPSKARSNEVDPEKARHLDLSKPRFPVALAADAPTGPRELKANVVYFSCSKREGWCRRGNAEVRITSTFPEGLKPPLAIRAQPHRPMRTRVGERTGLGG